MNSVLRKWKSPTAWQFEKTQHDQEVPTFRNIKLNGLWIAKCVIDVLQKNFQIKHLLHRGS